MNKENYRPISLLPHLSKVSEKIIYKQINSYMEDELTKYLAGFRKLHGTQYSLLTMLEKWKRGIDNEGYVSAIFLDHSKSFDTINHDLMLAKLKAYGFSTNVLNLMHSYLKNRKQKVQLITSLVQKEMLLLGFHKDLLNDLVFIIQHSVLSNYADDL